MTRFFNTSGLCKPEEHYMVNPFRGIDDEIYRLIEQKQYFLLHAPRQTGKTTFLHEYAKKLNREGKYTCVVFSVESAGVPDISLVEANTYMVNALWRVCPDFLPENEWPSKPQHPISLLDYLSAWARSQQKPIVLLIDEADSLWDDVMISFLRQLRDGFQNRPQSFPSSVALVGLRDIREYKMKARGNNPALGSGSPFNIKAESFRLPFFSREEVHGLLQQHTQDTGQVFSEAVETKLFQLSGGQPWLTNALANEIVAKMLKNDFSREITVDMVEEAKERLIAQRQTHLDSLAEKLQETRVRRVVMSIINGEAPIFDNFDDAQLYCRDLGIISPDKPIRFANPIYQEIITRILNSPLQEGFDDYTTQSTWYLKPDGRLDMDKLLQAFVDFYRWHSESWLERYEYKEAGHQLLLMAFLQRIINGGGRIEREMAVGNGRTDLAVFWKGEVFPIEIKIKYNERTLSDGLQQLSRYMDRLGQSHGYLMLFEKKPSTDIPWAQRLRREDVQHEGRRIMVLEL